jgi:hypothetical protein
MNLRLDAANRQPEARRGLMFEFLGCMTVE